MGKDVDITTTEEVTVKIYCYECGEELKIRQLTYDYQELEATVEPCKCVKEE